jgi:hypothetical protein
MHKPAVCDFLTCEPRSKPSCLQIARQPALSQLAVLSSKQPPKQRKPKIDSGSVVASAKLAVVREFNLLNRDGISCGCSCSRLR